MNKIPTDIINIEAGNDVVLCFPIVFRRFENGKAIDEIPDRLDFIQSVVITHNGVAQSYDFTTDGNKVVVSIPATLEAGSYDVHISGNNNGAISTVRKSPFCIVPFSYMANSSDYVQGSPILMPDSVFIPTGKKQQVKDIYINGSGTYSVFPDKDCTLSLVRIFAALSPSGTITITENGTYDVSKYKTCIVNVSEKPISYDVEVPLQNGTYNSGVITWYAGNGDIKLTQTKGNGTTGVSGSYIAAPRLYKGHILSIEGIDGVKIASVRLRYDGNYYGNDIAIGVSFDNSGNVINDEAKIGRMLSTTTGGTHIITVLTEDGESNVLLQNNATSKNVQFRPVNIQIEYYK